MKQSRKQPEVTRRAILEAAGEEFALHGFAGSGLGAIVARAGLTKGALFHHFPDKRSMVLGWIEGDLVPRLGQRWTDALADVSTLEGLKSWCRERLHGLSADDPMSVLVAMAAETAASDEALGAAFGRALGVFREALASAIGRGRSEGWIHRSIDPASEAAMLQAMLAGFSVTLRCDPPEGLRRQAVAAAEAYLETLRSA